MIINVFIEMLFFLIDQKYHDMHLYNLTIEIKFKLTYLIVYHFPIFKN
jgi:hypothetical protein